MRTVEEVQDKIGGMIGLDVVKDEIDMMVTSAINDSKRRARGKKVEPRNWNMVFAGPPGTGKTTVARDIAPLFHALGLTDNQKFLPITADDLKSEFKGGSAKEAKKVLESVKGGVLFIDEAYQLVSGDTDDYGRDAVAAILPMLEDPKTVVILGGYEKDLKKMLAVNAGAPSRFETTLNFESYTAGERAQILSNALTDNGFEITPDAREEMEEAVWLTGDGNARDVRGLANKIKTAFDQRSVEADADDDVITAEDVVRGAEMYELSGAPDVRIGDER
jgi:SpoVK/Ycf46/Vps4 family AAA+-type ATPase